MVNKLALSTSIVIIITLHIYGVNGFIRNCDQETKAEDGTDICQECMSGYYVAANKTACIGCIEGCSKCVDGISCGVCTYSFYLNEQKTCSKCIEGCDKCTNGRTCDSCFQSYYFRDNSTETCGKCIEGCQTCNNTVTCSNCEEGFVRSSDNKKCTSPIVDVFRFLGLIIIGIVLASILLVCLCFCGIKACLKSRNERRGNEDSYQTGNGRL